MKGERPRCNLRYGLESSPYTALLVWGDDMKWTRFLAGAAPCLALAGCLTPTDYTNRYGPDPAVVHGDLAGPLADQKATIDALVAARYGGGSETAAADGQGAGRVAKTPTIKETDISWYEIALLGYNVVDLKCDEYLRTIYKFDREKERFTASMIFADKATGAIMQASNVSSATMQVVSQAFGFTSNFGNALAESYLYKIRPAAVAGVVKKMRTTYRDDVEKSMGPAGAKPIRSPTTAFHSILEYRNLCYPETIEAKIEEALAGSKASADGATKGQSSNSAAPNITLTPAAAATQ